jgi:tripartite-type tricarboxylate transporter receptor subunit TctC
VVVQNRPGAGGNIGADSVAKAAADGYTLLMGNAGSNGINAAIYPGLPYDLERDFEPVTQVMRAPNVLVVNPSLGVSDVAQLVALLKASPGKYAYGSGGVGSSAHLSAELFKLMAGVDVLHVPYKGAGPALNAVIAGEVAMFLGNLPPAAGHIRTGRVKALGVTTAKRTPLLPEAPTLDETGLKGFETVAWFGLFAPRGTPAELVLRIRNEVAAGVATPEMRKLIESVGGEPVAGTPEAFKAVVQADIAKWKRVVAAAGIKAE